MSEAPIANESRPGRQRRILIAIAGVVVVGILALLIAQLVGGCWVDVGNEMGYSPAVGFVEPPRSSAPEGAVPIQGLDIMPGGDPLNPVSPSEASVAAGTEAHDLFCLPCHGEPGGATGPVGALFSPPPPHLDQAVGGLSDGQVYVTVTRGFGRMPPLGSRMSELDRWNIVNYLRTTQPQGAPASADPKERGAAVFASQCAGCHGPTGGGALGPALYPSSLTAQMTVSGLAAFIREGRAAHGMPAFGGRLDDDSLADVAALVKDLHDNGRGFLERFVQSGGQTTTTTAPGTTSTSAPPATTPPTTGAPAPGAGAPDPAVIARGEAAYSADCQPCHGAGGAGGTGPALKPNAFVSASSDGQVREVIENGRQGTAMPPWNGRIPPDDITALVTLLRSWQASPASTQAAAAPATTPPATAAAPASTSTASATTMGPMATPVTTRTDGSGASGDQEVVARGAELFSADCASCHGAEGAGGMGPQLKPSSFVSGQSDEQVRGVIENGRPGTAMPPWKDKLSPDDITALVALLRSWQGTSTTGAGGPGTTGGGDTGTTVPGAGTTPTTDVDGYASVPFTHRPHAEKAGMQCLFCHSQARRGPSADLPPLEICVGCHRWLSVQTANTSAVVAAYDAGLSVSWPRVYRAPDFVFFTHQVHIVAARISCSTCHGDVASMGLAQRAKDLNMGFCVGCHEQQPVDQVNVADCQICHK